MKTKTTQCVCEFRLKLSSYADAYYIKKALKLEAALKMKPKAIRIEMVGEGEIPADTVLLIRSILIARDSGTRLITHARSSLQGAVTLVWLLGEQRSIREDARVFFRRNPLADEDPVEVFAGLGDAAPKYKDSYSSIDPDDADYARVLEHINEFLPVDEFAGRIISVGVLREFGLIDNQDKDLSPPHSQATTSPRRRFGRPFVNR